MSAPNPEAGVPPGFEFWRAQLERLGERDPLQVMAESPDALDELFLGVSDERLRNPPAPGKWSPVQILGHLVDTEWIFGFRVRTILADARPGFPGIDQDRWVAAQGHAQADARVLLGYFRALRGINLAWWGRLDEADLERTGFHQEAGLELSLGLLRRILAGHDLHHRAHLEELLAQD